MVTTAGDDQGREAKSPDFSRFRVLVVEDDMVNREVLIGLLERLKVVAPAVAEDGIEALDRFSEKEFDLVLMDCQMPGMDGFEATRQWRRRETEEGKGAPAVIVAVTAFAMTGDREKCLACGMDDYLSKPVNGRALEGVFAKWLGGRGRAGVFAPTSPVESPLLDDGALKGLREDLGPETLAAIVPQFLSLLPRRTEEIISVAGEGKADELGRAAHTLKGNALQFGLIHLGDICLELERLGKADRVDESLDRLPELEDAVAMSMGALKTWLQEH